MKEYKIITIGREYASGGSAVGRMVGKELGIPVYGREILEMAARYGNTTPEHIEHLEETGTNSLLFSLQMMGNAASAQPAGLSGNDALQILESRIIQELAGKGSCVFIGRCAGWVLRERRDALNVFIRADSDLRMKRAIEEYDIPESRAEATIKAFDRRRANFYHSTTGLSWKEKKGYHMVLDSGRLGIETCADIVAGLCKK